MTNNKISIDKPNLVFKPKPEQNTDTNPIPDITTANAEDFENKEETKEDVGRQRSVYSPGIHYLEQKETPENIIRNHKIILVVHC